MTTKTELDELRERIARAKGWIKGMRPGSDRFEWRNTLPAGWTIAPDDAKPNEGFDAFGYLPDWPNDPAAAMGLLCEVTASLQEVTIRPCLEAGGYACAVSGSGGAGCQMRGKTVNEAICRAYLVWKEHK